MATNTSEHLGLHLWEPTDQVLRTEFNQNWTKIDTAVNAAQETAEAAQSAAEQRPYVIGSYTGNGGTQSITLGFQPSFVIITAQQTPETPRLSLSAAAARLPAHCPSQRQALP